MDGRGWAGIKIIGRVLISGIRDQGLGNREQRAKIRHYNASNNLYFEVEVFCAKLGDLGSVSGVFGVVLG
jgi:hypothetical protein